MSNEVTLVPPQTPRRTHRPPTPSIAFGTCAGVTHYEARGDAGRQAEEQEGAGGVLFSCRYCARGRRRGRVAHVHGAGRPPVLLQLGACGSCASPVAYQSLVLTRCLYGARRSPRRAGGSRPKHFAAAEATRRRSGRRRAGTSHRSRQPLRSMKTPHLLGNTSKKRVTMEATRGAGASAGVPVHRGAAGALLRRGIRPRAAEMMRLLVAVGASATRFRSCRLH